jgi:hypothetical protein
MIEKINKPNSTFSVRDGKKKLYFIFHASLLFKDIYGREFFIKEISVADDRRIYCKFYFKLD